MCAEIVDVMLAASFLPSGNQKRFWRDPDRAGAYLPRLSFPVDILAALIRKPENDDDDPSEAWPKIWTFFAT
jgi:hypothetical protein